MKRSKYNVRMDAAGKAKRTVDGILFASQLEADRYKDLKMLEKAGEIYALTLQPRYVLKVNGQTIGHYVADFRYHDRVKLTIEDCKGHKTALYARSKKHFEAQYSPLTITEITRHRRI